MTLPTKVKSGFAFLDVTTNHHALEKYFKANPDARIPVVITGHIIGPSSGFDGVSIEFSVDVTNVELL